MKINKDKIKIFIVNIYLIVSCIWIASDVIGQKDPCEEVRIEMEEAMEDIKSILNF